MYFHTTKAPHRLAMWGNFFCAFRCAIQCNSFFLDGDLASYRILSPVRLTTAVYNVIRLYSHIRPIYTANVVGVSLVVCQDVKELSLTSYCDCLRLDAFQHHTL